MPKRLIPTDWQPAQTTLAWCHANGYDAESHLEFFRDYCESTEAKYANFDAAFRNCCRSDWGGVRKNAKPKPVAHQVVAVPKVTLTPEQAAENRRKFEEMRANLMGAK